MKKLERMWHLLYAYGVERFGVVEYTRSTPVIPTKSRRQTKIDRLIKERRQQKKQWRKASKEEKESINLLKEEIQGRLQTLRRAENLLRKCRRKKKRSRFYKDPLQVSEEPHKGEEWKALSVEGRSGRTPKKGLH